MCDGGVDVLICAMVVLMGCSKDTPELPQAAEAEAQVTPAPTPKSDLVSPVGKKLIADPIVEKAIRAAIKKPEGELTKSDLDKVTALRFYANKLTEMPKELEKLTQLEYLALGLNQLTSVNGLEKLTQLEELDLRDNPDLTKAQIDELQKALPKCRIFDDFPLNPEEQAKIIEAAIREDAKKPTGELTKADLDKVTGLNLPFSKLTDIPKGLEKLSKLEELNLSNNQLTSVKGLEKLTKLKFLNLFYNPDLTKAQIDELQKALPKCDIFSDPTK